MSDSNSTFLERLRPYNRNERRFVWWMTDIAGIKEMQLDGWFYGCHKRVAMKTINWRQNWKCIQRDKEICLFGLIRAGFRIMRQWRLYSSNTHIYTQNKCSVFFYILNILILWKNKNCDCLSSIILYFYILMVSRI